MPSLKSIKTIVAFVLLGVVGAWMGCSDSAPVASRPASKATCALCDFLGDSTYTATDGLAAPESPDTTQTEAETETDSTQTADADSTQSAAVVFADANLERCVREALDRPSGTLTPADLAALTELEANYKNIESLAGLEHATALQSLALRGNAITDVSPLASLINLRKLWLWGNDIADMSPLASLISLRTLSLWGNEITDVSPLARLTNLQWLQLGDNDIADISPLASLTNLRWLGVTENALSQHAANQQLAASMASGLRVEAVLEKYPRVETEQVYPELESTFIVPDPTVLYLTEPDKGEYGGYLINKHSKIWYMNLDGSDPQAFFLPALERTAPGTVQTTIQGMVPEDIEVDRVNRKIYWADGALQGSIWRANLDGSDMEPIARADAIAIALDLVNRKIYWVGGTTTESIIGVVNLDGSDRRDLVTHTDEPRFQSPREIELDVANNKMYWTDNQAQLIQYANLDGSGVTDFRTGFYPGGLALDLVNRKIYWGRYVGPQAKIQWANLEGDGSDAQDLVTPTDVSMGPIWGPWFLEVDPAGGKIYWADRDAGQIGRADLDGQNPEIILTRGTVPQGLEPVSVLEDIPGDVGDPLELQKRATTRADSALTPDGSGRQPGGIGLGIR